MSSVELVDQKILNQLSLQIKRNRCATTYLFTGSESDKKKALAIAFAKALNCEKNGAPTCDCSSCKRIESGNHPDVKWYGADEDANSIKIADARDFKNWLSLKPYEGKSKVFIFNQAERLTGEAQNALLKSLEEPPPGNVIILLVPHAKSLYDTIASRAIEIKIPPFKSKEIQNILIDEGIEGDEAQFLARASQGELGRAKILHEENWFHQKNEWINSLMENPVSFLEEFHGVARKEAEQLFSFLIEWTRDLLIFQASEDPELLIHWDRFPMIESLVQRHSFSSILELYEGISLIKKSIDDYANVKLSLTNAEILLTHFIQK